MTRQIERLVKQFREAQKRANEIGRGHGYATLLAGEDLSQAALALAVAVSKHVAAQARDFGLAGGFCILSLTPALLDKDETEQSRD